MFHSIIDHCESEIRVRNRSKDYPGKVEEDFMRTSGYKFRR